MDPRLLFWTYAWLLLGGVVVLALRARQRVRAGEVEAHRRTIHAAAALVGLFLVSYALKLGWLGREQLALWTAGDRAVLRVHEAMMAVMLGSGVAARLLARRAGDAARFRGALHRRLGRIAILAAAGGFVTAGAVLYRMIARS